MRSSRLLIPAVLLLACCGCGSDSGQTHYELGCSALAQKEYDRAAESFTRAAQRMPDSAEVYYNLAVAYLALGRLDAAREAVGAALAVNPHHTGALVCEGQIAYYKKDFERAITSFAVVAKNASAAVILRAAAFNGLASVALEKRQADMARVYLIRAYCLAPRDAVVWYHLGVLYRDMYHMREEALEAFQMYLRLVDADDPHAVRTKNVIVPALTARVEEENATLRGEVSRNPGAAAKAIGEGAVLQSKKQFTAAIAKYREALKADPLAFNAAWGLGLVYSRQKNVAGALDAFKTAARINPTHLDSYIEAATLAHGARRYAEAAAILDRALARSPKNVTIIGLFAKIYAAQGHVLLARAYGELLVSLLSPNSPDYVAWEAWVASLRS